MLAAPLAWPTRSIHSQSRCSANRRRSAGSCAAITEVRWLESVVPKRQQLAATFTTNSRDENENVDQLFTEWHESITAALLRVKGHARQSPNIAKSFIARRGNRHALDTFLPAAITQQLPGGVCTRWKAPPLQLGYLNVRISPNDGHLHSHNLPVLPICALPTAIRS